MKHLRQYIRQILLTEGAKSWDAFPEDVAIVINHYDYGDGLDEVYIYYAVIDSDTGKPHEIRPFEDRINDINGERIYGKIGIHTVEDYGPCDGAMKVENSRASSGWGPLLYDVAIEYATIKANGLMPDRVSVSGEAKNVWNYYLGNRSDVIAHQLDDLKNTLTPFSLKDNCNQSVSRHEPGEVLSFDGDWKESPLSKRYTKKPITINKLKSLGLLVEL